MHTYSSDRISADVLEAVLERLRRVVQEMYTSYWRSHNGTLFGKNGVQRRLDSAAAKASVLMANRDLGVRPEDGWNESALLMAIQDDLLEAGRLTRNDSGVVTGTDQAEVERQGAPVRSQP